MVQSTNTLMVLVWETLLHHLWQMYSWMLSKQTDFFPKFYYRYVDDTLASFEKLEHAEQFLATLNQMNPSIKFTVEHAQNQSIPFLDVKLTLNESGLSTTIYRKPTFTGRGLNFKWLIPTHWKTSVIQHSLKRAMLLCSSWNSLHTEFQFLIKFFQFNGFPKWSIEKRISRLLNSHYNNHTTTERSQPTNLKYLPLNYYGRPTDILKKKLKSLFQKYKIENIAIALRTKKLQSLFSTKDKINMLLKSLVIYKYTCQGDPDNFYIGKTWRQFMTRLDEHKKNRTSVNDHLSTCSSCTNNLVKDNFKLINSAENKEQLEVMEAIYIKTENPPMNRQLFQSGASYLLKLFN